MANSEFLDPFTRLVTAIVTPKAVRGIEAGGARVKMWTEFEKSGFLDSLVSERHGGVGLSLADVGPLVSVLGANAVPLPVAETMVARALLAEAGIESPDGPIAFATSAISGSIVPFGLVATHVMIDSGEAPVLAPSAALSLTPTGVPYSLAGRITCPVNQAEQLLPRPDQGLRPLAAVLRATLISGAVARVVEMSTTYANNREQFGKPIGRQQAIQQNLAVMAQEMVASRIAAQLACAAGMDGGVPVAAMAKSIASAAAAKVAVSAHAVHGAIGMSEEYDLHLLTRRLHEWRLADGSSRYWDAVLGEARLADPAPTLEWTRRQIFGAGRQGMH